MGTEMCLISSYIIIIIIIIIIKVTLTHDINSSNISLLRTAVLECTDHQPAEEYDASMYPV